LTVLTLPRRFKRPLPPVDGRGFVPAPELSDWLREVFIAEDGPLRNERYTPLREADIACLWTWEPNERRQRMILAQAELMPPMAMGKWQKARALWQIEEWFGDVPDFLLTFDARFAVSADNSTFCAVAEHELHHCGQEVDKYGEPRFTQEGEPKFCLVGHDVEEFVGVVERYGASATGLERMREALNSKPSIGLASITAACGTCAQRKHG
jgi:hypothetical protein